MKPSDDKNIISSIPPVTLADAETLSNMVKVLVHDLMNQVAAFKLNGDLVKNYPDHMDSETLWGRLEPLIQRIEVSAMQVRNINRKLLNPREMVFKDFYIVEAVRSMVEKFRGDFENKSINLKVELPFDDIVVHGDESTIKEGIIFQLLSNALKFTESGGEVCVKVDSIGDKATIKVADTGIGIPSEWIDKLLTVSDREEFRRKGTDGELGFGFGLHAAHLLAEYFKGELKVETHDLSSDQSLYCTVFRFTI